MRHLLGWGRPVLTELLFHVRNLPFASLRARQTDPGRFDICELAVPVLGLVIMPSSKPAHKAPFKRSRQMLTTQQAAAELNVSRPYVVELVEKGTFKGVEFTGSGHRRIPAIEVQRVRTHMQSGMRKGIDAIAELTEEASQRESEEATRNATRRWRTLSR